MIRIGLLGAGYIAQVMADTVNRMNQNGMHQAVLTAVGARDLARAGAFAARNGIPTAYGSYEELAAADDVDLIYVATPHSHHHEHATLCLEHGKHVLCEKAFTVNAHEAEDLIRLAKSKGLLVTEAIWTRYQPMRQIINEVVFSGSIGKPVTLTANLSYPMEFKERIMKPELAGGGLLDVGIYALNFAEMVFGHPDSVQAAGVLSPEGIDLTAGMALTWKDGRMAMLTTGVTAQGDSHGIIYGSEGYAVVDNINNPSRIRVMNRAGETLVDRRCPPQLTGYEYEVLEAAAAIEAGETECASMPHAETLHMMRLMDAIRLQLGVKYPMED